MNAAMQGPPASSLSPVATLIPLPLTRVPKGRSVMRKGKEDQHGPISGELHSKKVSHFGVGATFSFSPKDLLHKGVESDSSAESIE